MINKEVLEDLLQVKYAIIDDEITTEVDMLIKLDEISKKHNAYIPSYFKQSLKEILDNG